MATKKPAGNQWDFGVPGNNNKMCKSLSQIDESFKNSKGTEIVSKGNRYRAILCKLADCANLFDLFTSDAEQDKLKLQKAREKFSKISQIFVSFTDVYYRYDGRLFGGSYLSYMPKLSGFEKYLDLKYNITKKAIQDKNGELSMYKKMGTEEAQNILRQDIMQCAKNYVSLYRGREMIAGNKRIADIFFGQDVFVFDSLHAIFFVDNSANNPNDYMSVFNNTLLAANVEAIKAKNNIIDFNDELLCLQRYVKMLEGAGTKFKNISKVYVIPNFDNCVSFMHNATAVDLSSSMVYTYVAPTTLDDVKNKAEIDEYAEKSQKIREKCLQLIKRMNTLVREGSIISEVSNPTEKTLWASHLSFEAVKSSLDYLVTVVKSNVNNTDDTFGEWLLKNGNKVSITDIFTEGTEEDKQEIKYFLQYLPKYVFDDRHTELNQKAHTIEEAKNIYGKCVLCYNILFGVLEMFLGVQMGTLAIYMKRYGFQGIDFVLNLFPSIKTNVELYTTPNVTKLAEFCVYKDLNVSAIKSEKTFYDSPAGKEILGPFVGFASVAFKRIVEFTKSTPDYVLTHTYKENPKAVKTSNLLIVLNSVEGLFVEYRAFFHMD